MKYYIKPNSEITVEPDNYLQSIPRDVTTKIYLSYHNNYKTNKMAVFNEDIYKNKIYNSML